MSERDSTPLEAETRSVTVALAQANATVGHVLGNVTRVRDFVAQAVTAGAELVIFGEMMLSGVPVEDLALQGPFQRRLEQALDQLALDLLDDGCGDIPVIVGTLVSPHYQPGVEHTPGNGPAHNIAAVLHEGKVKAQYIKQHLTAYGVFDETRTATPGQQHVAVSVGGVTFALAICEDLLLPDSVGTFAREVQADAMLVLNASPFDMTKADKRLETARDRVAQANAALIYVNLVGGQDDLIFDGQSFVLSSDGELLAQAPSSEEHLLLHRLTFSARHSDPRVQQISPPRATMLVHRTADVRVHPAIQRGGKTVPTSTGVTPEMETYEHVWRALTLAIADYTRKNGFQNILIGLSGGIDSALVATLSCDALGARRVYGVSMPSEFSSQHSRDDAYDLAVRLGMHYRIVEIHPMVYAVQQQLQLTGVAAENLQARIRGLTLMGISNMEGQLVVANGNKTELAVGYSTLYGDAVGGFAPIRDLPKTLVWELARWRNQQALQTGQVPPIPESSIEKPPSAELRPGQQDTDSLPDYDVLDPVLHQLVDLQRAPAQVNVPGATATIINEVAAMVRRSEFKRRQYPIGPKVTPVSFGRDRIYPVTSRWLDPAVVDTNQE